MTPFFRRLPESVKEQAKSRGKCAIELEIVLLITILKIKYEGKAFIRGLGTLVDKSKQLQQKQKASENEIRSAVTTGVYPNDFITFLLPP